MDGVYEWCVGLLEQKSYGAAERAVNLSIGCEEPGFADFHIHV